MLPSSIQASLGQTLWLYAEVEKNDQESKALATACAIALLEKTPLDPVPVHQGKLFGSLIFEYEATDPEEPQNQSTSSNLVVLAGVGDGICPVDSNLALLVSFLTVEI